MACEGCKRRREALAKRTQEIALKARRKWKLARRRDLRKKDADSPSEP